MTQEGTSATLRRRIGGFALTCAAACGGFNTAGLLPERPDAGRPGEAETGAGAGAGSGADLAGDDGGALHLAMPDEADASSSAAPPSADASDDARASTFGPLDGAAREGSFTGVGDAADGAPVDMSTPCGDLTRCCGNLVIAPPLAAACYAPTFASDAGNGPACKSTLESFRDAGLCP